jgi:hypothetical protein
VKRFSLLLPAALVAILALCATQASASRLVATELSGKINTYLKATPLNLHEFVPSGLTGAPCSASSFTYTMGSTQGVSQFSAEGLEDYKCAVPGPATMKLNGCSLTFHPGAEIKEFPGDFNGTLDIGPAGCGPLTIVWGGGCELKFYPKTGLSAYFFNEGSGKMASVRISVQAEGIKTAGNCGGTGEKGEYWGEWELVGSTSPTMTNPTGIAVSTNAALYLEGAPTKFNGEVYPEPLRGSVSTANVFTIPSTGTVSCKKGSFSGSLAAPSTQLSLAAAYSECPAFGFAKTIVKNNGCNVVLNATTASSGTASLSCPEGKAFTVEPTALGVPICAISFPSQSLGSVTYETVGIGVNRKVVAAISASGIQYTSSNEKSSCGPSGSNATFSGGLEAQGSL